MPLIDTLSTANTFRQWLTTTNVIIGLLNSNTVIVGGEAIGAFTIGNTIHTGSSLSINPLSGGGAKTVANMSGLFMKANSSFASNVSVTADAAAFTVQSTTAVINPSGGTTINGGTLLVSTTLFQNGAATINNTLTVTDTATFQKSITVSNTVVASNTVYSRAAVFTGSDSIVAATISTTPQHNLTVSGLTNAMVLNIDASLDIELTGIEAPTNLGSTGLKLLYINNKSGSAKITIKNDDSRSLAANRIKTSSGDVDVPAGTIIPLIYIYAASSGYWRPLAAPSGLVSTLSVAGAAAIGGTLSVGGTASFASNVAFDTNVLFIDQVNNRVGVNVLPSYPLHVSGAAFFNGNANVAGNFGVSGSANALGTFGITGAANALNTFGVTGLFSALGGASVTGALSTTGAASVGTNLTVSGASIFTGAANALGIFGISGAANALSSLGVTALLTASGGLLVGAGQTANIGVAAGASTAFRVFGDTTLTGTASIGGVLTTSANVVCGANVYANTAGAGGSHPAYLYIDKMVAYGNVAALGETVYIGDGTRIETKEIREGRIGLGTLGASQTLSLANGTIITGTFAATGGTTAFTLPTPTAGTSFMAFLKQNNGSLGSPGNASWATPSGSIKWPNNGSAPTITTTASRTDIFSFVADGTDWYASYVQNY